MPKGTVDFEGHYGECSKIGDYFDAFCDDGMHPDETATLNGSALGAGIVGNEEAAIFDIKVRHNSGLYEYELRIEAQGPRTPFGGSVHLAFEDMTGDVYYLSIYSARREWHSLRYNSASPAIRRIFWSNHAFTVDACEDTAPKADYQVVSPARSAA